jgi:hypothetical protein
MKNTMLTIQAFQNILLAISPLDHLDLDAINYLNKFQKLIDQHDPSIEPDNLAKESKFDEGLK